MNKKVVVGIVSVVLISCLLIGSFAWFYINQSTYVDFGSDILCEAGESLEISDDGGKSWSGVISKEGFSFETIDITGDGVSFYKPLEIDATASPVGFTDAFPMDADGNGEYVDIELMFRSVSKMNVYLSAESYILPADPDKEGNIFGDFSRDYIAGATRAAFLHNGEVKMIWAPNPGYELTRNVDGSYNFNENGTPESGYYYTVKQGTDYVKTPFTTDDLAFSKFVSGSTGANAVTEGKSAKLFTLAPTGDDYAVETIKVRIWFEGTDREASEALAGGKVKIKLKFTGIEKENNTVKEQQIKALAYSDGNIIGLINGMSYSLDGLTWTKYNSQTSNLPDLSQYDVIYFRYDETSTEFSTSVKKISLS